nr:immunoglobulin heavy chain junction region [Mus musculus]NSM06608.1 immunoglobulin heavy chain junction region [Mus musculus]NSM07336.1 immunoglobulin heavy chain junction region [Mus musculus]NSM08795.1 immunoglobulin heavy chain junction region [Mus musculus]
CARDAYDAYWYFDVW